MEKTVPVLRAILSSNDRAARQVRQGLRAHGLLSINLMSSPGAGKTSFILACAAGLRPLRTGVIEGDVAGRVDADLIAAHGFPVVQINTGGSCHLEASEVGEALLELPLAELDVLWVENVGNLICPVSYDLGTDLRVVLASVPEGHDKPGKYPAIFGVCDAVVISKIDLADLLEFDRAAFVEGVRVVAPEVPIFEVSSKTGQGLSEWLDWLRTRRGAGATAPGAGE